MHGPLLAGRERDLQFLVEGAPAGLHMGKDV